MVIVSSSKRFVFGIVFVGQSVHEIVTRETRKEERRQGLNVLKFELEQRDSNRGLTPLSKTPS